MYANEVGTKEKEKLPESLCGFPVIKRQSLGRGWSKSLRLTRSSWKSSRLSRSSCSLVCFASYTSPDEKSEKRTSLWIQLFRERLSTKVHATIPQSNVGGFEFTVPQRNFKEGQEKAWTNVCECQRKVSKVSSTATVSGTLYWSYPILPFEIVTCTFFFPAANRNLLFPGISK